MSPGSRSNLNDRLKDLDKADDDDSEANDSLVIGIDFGTTYSGVAWATKVDFENHNINSVVSWPGNGREESKVPTELWYGNNEELVWGYDVPVDIEPFRWFKLLLLRAEDLDPELRDSAFVVRARHLMATSGRTAVDLIADYLRSLWKHTMSTIEKARGVSVVEALPIHIVVTVPAIWKGYARQAMEESIKKSGILVSRLAGTTNLTFVPEPEAAALSTLLEQGSGVRQGNVYIICDAGGGTVDLISYRVKSKKPIVLQEAVEGTGGLCGGIFIDQAFEHICSGRLGSSKWKSLSKIGLRDVMKKEWEYGIKPQFKPGQAGKQYIVSLPAELDVQSLNDTKREPHIKDGRIYFADKHIEKAFESVFAEIEDLVKEQIRKVTEKNLPITGIILVGGLGASPYLYDYLTTLHSKAGIAVLQSRGAKPRTAICRGAVIKGFLEQHKLGGAEMPIVIASTVSRASYGTICISPFNPFIHLKEDMVWCTKNGLWMANNQTKWYLKRGQVVSMMKPVRISWYALFREEEFNGTLSIALLQCDDEAPPERGIPSVQRLATLYCSLDVLYSDLPNYKNKTGVKILIYELEMVPSGASLEFTLYVGGRKQGGKSVMVNFG
ncbi:hypothetical protein F5Y12DRAFT_786866 [Xylaria sp. FL1777]|nr:hypothetical protein F5Y12DRAFT_786866 [Xylaria sp. FL1777]